MIDYLFPETIAFDSGSEEAFETDIFTGENRIEVRTERSTGSRGVFDVVMQRPTTDLETVKALFLLAAGRLRTFKYRDPRDYSVSSAHIGTGDGVNTTFDLVRPYWSSTWYYGKPVYRARSTSILITVNNVPTTEFTVSSTPGKIVMLNPPASSALVRASFEFDKEVRFAEDTLAITLNTTVAAALHAKLIEVSSTGAS